MRETSCCACACRSRADIFKEIDILLSLEHENIVLMKGEGQPGRVALLAAWHLELRPQERHTQRRARATVPRWARALRGAAAC